ncbi:MAG TPA: hypothetical protein VFB56_11410, partial [Nitrospiraceae bacterium]|nr:hypothetical protein [Nitrospiraceae bacterium]
MTATNKNLTCWSLIGRENLPLLLLVCLYEQANVFTTRLFRLTSSYTALTRQIGHLIEFIGVIFVGCFFIFQFGLRVFRYRRHVAFLRQAWKEVCQQYGTFDRLIGYIIVWVLLLPFFATVVNFREMISQIIPFTWDPWLQETSRSLHWGF